ncbi:MAG: ATP-binding protein [Myxococcota bacterium]
MNEASVDLNTHLLIVDGSAAGTDVAQRLAHRARVLHATSWYEGQQLLQTIECPVVWIHAEDFDPSELRPWRGRSDASSAFGQLLLAGPAPTRVPEGWTVRHHFDTAPSPELLAGLLFEIAQSSGLVDGTPPYHVLLQTLAAERERAASLERKLHHSDRLVTIGHLAAGVAHEVNNPTSFVSANLCILGENLTQIGQALAGQGESAPDVESLLKDCWDIVNENLEGMGRISSIVRNLKTFSRLEEGMVEMVHPNQVINAACNLAFHQIRHRAKLVKNLGDVPAMAMDRNKVTQVLLNLLLNAAHAIPEEPGDHYIKVVSRREDDALVIEVKDTGVGIPDAIRERIFEPFFTTKGRDRGSGLGLSLCADIVSQHQGRIDVSSVEGQGTSMKVVLPLENGLTPGAPRSNLDSGDLPEETRRARILLIDDEPMLLKAFQRFLKRGHKVITAAGGREALDVLVLDRTFDVIICDLMMPGVDGVAVYRETEKLRPELLPRFIFCSGGTFTPRVEQFCQSISNPLLEKPVSPQELTRAIQKQLDRHPPAKSSDDLPPSFEGEDLEPTRSLS